MQALLPQPLLWEPPQLKILFNFIFLLFLYQLDIIAIQTTQKLSDFKQ